MHQVRLIPRRLLTRADPARGSRLEMGQVPQRVFLRVHQAHLFSASLRASRLADQLSKKLLLDCFPMGRVLASKGRSPDPETLALRLSYLQLP